jgi:phosphoribosylformylglycinamidine cyclo-ligase
MSLKYDLRGVSASKSEVHAAITHLDKGLHPTAFCKILPDYVGGDPQCCNILHADTAGTKTSLAYLHWRETGDLNVWAGVVQDAIVMNLDDMACVGCTDHILLSSTIGRNRLLIPAEVVAAIIKGSTDFIENMANQGINLHLAGGETADVGDIVRTVDVGFTAFARIPRKDLIINNIEAGNVIVGLASFGHSVYESEYNGGIGSNGLTAARHDVLHREYALKYPESYDPNLPDSVTYTGNRRLEEEIQISWGGRQYPTNVGKLLLSPTRTYLPLLHALYARLRNKIRGVIHCTGGGQTKVLKFVNGVNIIKDCLFETPPLFRLIQSESQTSWEEMYQVFNMGHRMELYLPPDLAGEVIRVAGDFGIDAQVIGRVEVRFDGGASVRIESATGTYVYVQVG